MKQLQKFYPHALAVIGFVLVSLAYFYPVLSGKQIFQSDIVQYTGMAKEQNDFRAAQQTEPYWTNSAFGGMPTYQLGANYPHDYIGKLDDALRFLPRPADYLMLYFVGFYLLLIVLRTNPLKAFFGALAFGLSTYLIIILGVGHNAKAHAIAYMPMVVAGVILVFRQRYLAGGLLTMVAAALEINANHFQMTYYLLLLLLVLSVYFAAGLIKEKNYKALGISIATFVVAGILAIGANATNIMATAEYTDFSMRGKSELTFNPDGSQNTTTSSMKYDYITEYSYGIAESLNLIAPRLFGGSNSEVLGKESESYQYAIAQGASEAEAAQFASSLPTYWGDQPIVAAPAYIGAVVFFLCVLALFADNRKIKYAFLAAALLSLLLSWGKNFAGLTQFFIDYVPLYDKFRAVSSIQVILELCMPVLAVMGLHAFFNEQDEAKKKKALRYAGAVSLGIIAFLFVAKGMFTFSGANDARMFGDERSRVVLDLLKADRESLYLADLLRSGFLITVAFGVLWLSLKSKIQQQTAVIIVGVVMIGDLFFVDKKYVKNDDQTFVSASQIEQPFQATEADNFILRDTSHYRVYDVFGRLEGRTSYFHKSVGGYSAVRPRRMDQLFEYQVDRELQGLFSAIDTTNFHLTRNSQVLDMLNVKYLIMQTNDGQHLPLVNPTANGNAWFVKQLRMAGSADAEMRALDKMDTKNVAIVNQTEFGALVKKTVFEKDSTASISVAAYKPNYIKYKSRNAHDGLAVFSEMYYGNGWNAYIDGKKADHFRADYVLRAMHVPAGSHTIEFKFEPEVVQKGGTIALASSVLMVFLIVGGIYFERRKLWFKDQK
ncbi:YfhO family protein [Flavobacterium caeni]|uniref:Membrane protein YfhO n=1 Tax=Flavobacterium caeni TaxID=490189 RepID=A0A1G5IX75_9FLAO|nr:YfhO family protein [Flavobacterium caeni]SCY80672.1 hypothetical protein SAMN02927903_02451 [Flavobacterium caeni]